MNTAFRFQVTIREVAAEFGEVYARYAAATPAFLPRIGAAPMQA